MDCVVSSDGWVELVAGRRTARATSRALGEEGDDGPGECTTASTGRVVQVTAWNTPTPTTDAAPGTPPVLRTQELLDIVQDPGWFDPA